MLRRLKKYQESGPIKDARAVAVLRIGSTGFPNIAPCLFVGNDVGICYWKGCGAMFISSSLSNTLQVVENNCKDYPDLRKKKDEPNDKSNFILLTAICIAN